MKVSVIIPVYNREKVVGECIDSVLAQICQDFEIVLIDDGSSDNSVQVCEEYAKKDSRIRLLKAEHGGVSAARNMGLENSSGEYVFFIDSDDVIHPRVIGVLLDALQNSDAAIAGVSLLNVNEKQWATVKERIAKSTALGDTAYHSNEQTVEAVFSSQTPLDCIGGVMMHRDLIGDTRFDTNMHVGEDFYFIYQNLIKGANAVFLKQKWYYVRIHSTNASWDFGFTGFWSRFYRRKLVWESEESLGRTKYANRQKKEAFFNFVTCIQKNKPYSVDSKKMRGVLREYKKCLLPAMSTGTKLFYIACAYLPLTTLLILKLRGKK